MTEIGIGPLFSYKGPPIMENLRKIKRLFKVQTIEYLFATLLSYEFSLKQSNTGVYSSSHTYLYGRARFKLV